MDKSLKLIESGDFVSNTLRAKNFFGLLVISSKGFILGKVGDLRINSKTNVLEGILVNRGMFKKSVFLGMSYVKKYSEKAFILKIDPVFLLKGKRVFDSQGNLLGRVRKIVREGNTNKLKEIVAYNFWGRRFKIKAGDIKNFDESVLLKSGYNGKKNYFGKKLTK